MRRNASRKRTSKRTSRRRTRKQSGRGIDIERIRNIIQRRSQASKKATKSATLAQQFKNRFVSP